ncbi:hypothetical protein [Nocardia goodfellowii]|uniref:DUF8176 domain-containing protein n=1 Tax=Nocardia goodfellowii TaxID=882446 RepID=A0ABS4QGS7_9NOCA|nr:hypothetical protein [Nocardia goodfellowii]MBP2190911.1 hypothetical protein [Nocardia goodfellowii]
MDRPDTTARRGGNQDYQGEWSDWISRESSRSARSRDPEYFEGDRFSQLVDRSKGRPPVPRWLVPLAGSLFAAVVLGAAFFMFQGGPTPQSVASNTSTEIDIAPASVTPPAAVCPNERVGNRIQGNGVGGVDSGPGAIFAFQHAFYVERSAEKARALVASDAAVSSVAALQQGIDSVPAGTTHCVAVTESAFVGQYIVVVTEHRPDGNAFTYNAQLVVTERNGGKTLITAIKPA